MIKADPFAQLKLLDVQALDARIAQLTHRRRSLPEVAELEQIAQERRVVDDHARDARIAADDLRGIVRKAELDVEQVRTRRERDQKRLDSGQVSNPKDLERLQSELVSLERRIGVLEDEEIEVMEQLEEAERTLAAHEARLSELDARVEALVASRDEAFAGIDDEITGVQRERVAMVADLPADLLGLYDRLREQKGIGAAELRRGECGGCRLAIDAAELAVIRSTPVDTVVRCEECSRILVRTGESGL